MLGDQFRGPAAVTVSYFVVYYAFMILQLNTRADAKDRAEQAGLHFDRVSTRDPGATMGERTFLNTLEQMGPFLASLWTCALCVSPGLSTVLGGIAVISRVLFPLLWSMGPRGEWNPLVELSTQPYYICVFGMLGAVAAWAFAGVNITHAHWALVLLAVVSFYAALFGLAFVLGKGVHVATRSAYAGGHASPKSPTSSGSSG